MRLDPKKEAEILAMSASDRNGVRDGLTTDILNSKSSKQLLLSAAGTGKTYLFRALIKKWIKEGVPQNKILLTSFINFIVDDLKNEIHEKEKLIDVKVLTLHKLAKNILYKYLGGGGIFSTALSTDFQIALGNDDETLIAADMKVLDPTLEGESTDIWKVLRRHFQSPDKYPQPPSFPAYLEITSFYDAITFDDSIARATQALKARPGVMPIDKILVDEYQDFNKAEQLLIEQIVSNSKGGVIAGDDDQCLYLSKGADFSGIIDLYHHADWDNKNLPFCSRTQSAAVIHSAAEICRRQIRLNRVDKSYLPLTDNGKKVKVVDLMRSIGGKGNPILMEAEYIAQQITPEKIEEWEKRGGTYPAYLILGKTRHLKMIAKVIKERTGIEVKLKAKNVYDDKQVRVLHSYLQLLRNPQNNLAFRRLLDISNEATEEIFLEAVSAGGFSRVNSSAIEKIKANIVTLQAIEAKEQDTEVTLLEMSKALKLKVKHAGLSAYINQMKSRSNLRQLKNQLEDIAIEQQEEERKKILGSPIQGLTITSSKGLKADVVFVLGLEEGYLPVDNSAPSDAEINQIYVAMTRTVEDLHLLTCRVRSDGVYNTFGGVSGIKKKSIFLSWLEADKVETVVLDRKDFPIPPTTSVKEPN